MKIDNFFTEPELLVIVAVVIVIIAAMAALVYTGENQNKKLKKQNTCLQHKVDEWTDMYTDLGNAYERLEMQIGKLESEKAAYAAMAVSTYLDTAEKRLELNIMASDSFRAMNDTVYRR